MKLTQHRKERHTQATRCTIILGHPDYQIHTIVHGNNRFLRISETPKALAHGSKAFRDPTLITRKVLVIIMFMCNKCHPHQDALSNLEGNHTLVIDGTNLTPIPMGS